MKLDILLDMDGVIADFTSAAFRASGATYDESRYPPLVYDHETVLGISRNQFWRNIDAAPGFWETLNPYPWLAELVSLVGSYDPDFIISTTPSKDPACVSGKIDWIERHLGKGFDTSKRIMLGAQKHRMSRPGAVLIDDRDENIREFVNGPEGDRPQGGHAILFPQKWNARYKMLPCDRVKVVADGLDRILARWSG